MFFDDFLASGPASRLASGPASLPDPLDGQSNGRLIDQPNGRTRRTARRPAGWPTQRQPASQLTASQGSITIFQGLHGIREVLSMVFQGIDPGTIWDGSSGDLELIRSRSGDVLEMFLEFCGVSSARRCAALPLIPRGAALEPFTV